MELMASEDYVDRTQIRGIADGMGVKVAAIEPKAATMDRIPNVHARTSPACQART